MMAPPRFPLSFPVKQISNLAGLLSLNMAGNRLSVIPPEIGLLSALKRLGLKGNALVRLPGSLGDLSQLSELYLTRNNLEELPSEVRRRVSNDAGLMGGREGRLNDIFAETSTVEAFGLLTARVGHDVKLVTSSYGLWMKDPNDLTLVIM